MDTPSRPRRTRLGPCASAALPTLWKAVARLGWSHAEFARRMEVTSAGATRLLYGDCRAGRRVGILAQDLLGVRPVLWDKACPPNWKPNAYASLRPKARAAADDDEGEPALAATGTDD